MARGVVLHPLASLRTASRRSVMTGAEGVRLERPTLARAAQFLSSVRRSRSLHRGWVSPPSDRSQYEQYIRSLRSSHRAAFFVITSTEDLAGVVNVNEIVHGVFLSAYLGYYAFEPFAGHGFLHRGLGLVIGRCFGELGLHRLEANIQPENARSIDLVKGLGFRLEGFSPRYLKIGGRWRDHERWALLADEWRQRKRRRSSAREQS